MEKGFALRESQPMESRKQNFFNSPDNMLAIYAASCLLTRVGERFGLQGMDAYLKSYIRTVGRREPKLKAAVDVAVGMINIEKMYHKAVNN